MPNYMLLVHGEPTRFAGMNPVDAQKATERYMAWASKPFVVDAKRLARDAGRVMRACGGKTSVTDGPYSETKEMLGGYYTIEAANYDEAVARAMDHPHLEYGGTIEVRETWSGQ
ncbi:MAG TPA: YciI family protein [Candidatus Sulfopaludibacter sp.]|nr:YciI family protein [Candidatus Sulfopaludibacter sp.]